MSSRRSRKKSPEEKLRRKIRKKVKNQSGFLKHAITYLVLFTFFMLAAFVIREEGFVIPFLILFSCWMLGLVFHGLSAFVFHRIDSWEETQYQKKLTELHLHENHQTDAFQNPDTEDEDEYMDLRSYDELRKKMDEGWNEGDFV